jgi:protease I
LESPTADLEHPSFLIQPSNNRKIPGGTMAKKDLTGKRVAILVDEGFEQVELIKPRKALDKIGAKTEIVSPQEGQVRGWNVKKWGKFVPVDIPLNSADPANYDALLLPGGVMNPDKLRMNPKAVEFVKHFFDSGKPVASICHGPWMVVEAGAASGRTLTSWPSLQTDIRNAGGVWIDQEVVTDQRLVTSRNPDDIKAFNKKMIEEFAEGQQVGLGERRIA